MDTRKIESKKLGKLAEVQADGTERNLLENQPFGVLQKKRKMLIMRGWDKDKLKLRYMRGLK